MLKRIILALGLLLAPTAALAQSSVLPYYYNAGGTKVPVGSSNPLPISGSFSASLSPFTPGLAGARATPLSVTIADSSGNLPTNTGSVIVYNVGANPMYCNVNGIAATTADQYISSSGGWFNFGIPVGTTTLHCIATGGSTTANAAGGTGLGAGTGGGSGGGGGGAVTVADGADVTQGAIADAAATAGAAGTVGAKLRLMTTQLGTLNTTLGSPFQAGGSIGNTTFASTQSGTWNIGTVTTLPALPANQSTNEAQINGVTPLMGNGPSGTGSQRVNIASDNTAFSVNASVPTWAGGTLGAMANYGTSPGAVLAPGVNAFVTNTNANGQATAANSSPVVLPAAQVTADPCSLGNKTNFTFATSSGTVQIVAPSGSTQVYICSLFSVGATASIQNLVGGTGATCTTGTPVAMAGSTTAASGMSFAANGGFTFGNGGGTALRTTTAGHGVCLIQSATAAIAGGGTYVQQ